MPGAIAEHRRNCESLFVLMKNSTLQSGGQRAGGKGVMGFLDGAPWEWYLHCRYGGVRMHIRVQKWGNSLAVRIPKPLAEDAKVEEGTVLNLAVSEGKVIATPVKKNKQSLKQMLAKVTRKNLHVEVESGAPVGREGW